MSSSPEHLDVTVCLVCPEPREMLASPERPAFKDSPATPEFPELRERLVCLDILVWLACLVRLARRASTECPACPEFPDRRETLAILVCPDPLVSRESKDNR